MNLPISSNAKNLASNLLGSHGGGLANKAKLPFGGLFGDKEKEKEKAKSESGKIAPQYATAKDAEIQLLNYEPLLLAKDDIDLLSTDWEDGATGTDITHIQNYVRGELMRREKNYGMHYPTERTGTNDRGTHASTEFGDMDLGIGSQGFLDDEYVDTIYRGDLKLHGQDLYQMQQRKIIKLVYLFMKVLLCMELKVLMIIMDFLKTQVKHIKM